MRLELINYKSSVSRARGVRIESRRCVRLGRPAEIRATVFPPESQTTVGLSPVWTVLETCPSAHLPRLPGLKGTYGGTCSLI